MKTEKTSSILKKLKKAVGDRFKLFRIKGRMAQKILAEELKVHQSTITNIEIGTTFPKVNYLHYLYREHRMNINWLVTGDGQMYRGDYTDKKKKTASSIMYPHIEYDDPKYKQYQELSMLMRIPDVEQAIFGKLWECKLLLNLKEGLEDLKNERLGEGDFDEDFSGDEIPGEED